MTLPPALVVHSLDHVRAALRPGRAVTLLSAPGAANYAGCAWWRAMLAAAGTDAPIEAPDILDCADAPGRALEALAVGCRRIILYPCPAWPSIGERATAAGATLLSARPAALDLGDPTEAWRIEAWLGIG